MTYSTPHPCSPQARKALAGVICALTMLILIPPAADAATPPGAGRGAIGPVQVYPGLCTTANQFRSLGAPPPRIYAPDRTAGAGNDRLYVRFRLYLRNYAGQVVRAYPGYSGLAVARDDQPAAFSGRQVFVNVPPFAKLTVYVEWRDQARRIGWATYDIPTYLWIRDGQDGGGNLAACPTR